MIVEPLITLPDKIKKDDIIEIQTLISYRTVVTNTQKTSQHNNSAQDSKKTKDMTYLSDILASFNGQPFFNAKFMSPLSAHPYLSFFLKVSEAGLLKVTWVENSGKSWSLERKIEIS